MELKDTWDNYMFNILKLDLSVYILYTYIYSDIRYF